MKRSRATPLSYEDESRLRELLELADAAYDFDGLLGVLHAVGVAPTFIEPSSWVHLLLGEEVPRIAAEELKEFFDLCMRLYNFVLDTLEKGGGVIPPATEVEACTAFARGYTDGACLDPEWTKDGSKWTFVSAAACLCGSGDLVDPQLVAEFEAEPDVEAALCLDLIPSVLAAYAEFREANEDIAPEAFAPPDAAPRIGRNDPCPCGSGKKYKRCCLIRMN